MAADDTAGLLDALRRRRRPCLRRVDGRHDRPAVSPATASRSASESLTLMSDLERGTGLPETLAQGAWRADLRGPGARPRGIVEHYMNLRADRQPSVPSRARRLAPSASPVGDALVSAGRDGAADGRDRRRRRPRQLSSIRVPSHVIHGAADPRSSRCPLGRTSPAQIPARRSTSSTAWGTTCRALWRGSWRTRWRRQARLGTRHGNRSRRGSRVADDVEQRLVLRRFGRRSWARSRATPQKAVFRPKGADVGVVGEQLATVRDPEREASA